MKGCSIRRDYRTLLGAKFCVNIKIKGHWGFSPDLCCCEYFVQGIVKVGDALELESRREDLALLGTKLENGHSIRVELSILKATILQMNLIV